MSEDASGLSIPERYFPDMAYFGCGPANPKGLRLRSFEAGTETIADFTPWPEHDHGLGFLNGGIICTILDCHSATAMVLEAQRQGLVTGESLLPFVTAGLEIKYLRPTPLDADIATTCPLGQHGRVGDAGGHQPAVGRQGAGRGHRDLETLAAALITGIHPACGGTVPGIEGCTSVARLDPRSILPRWRRSADDHCVRVGSERHIRQRRFAAI